MQISYEFEIDEKTHSRVHENEIHLHESEDQLQNWVNALKNLETRR